MDEPVTFNMIISCSEEMTTVVIIKIIEFNPK